MERLLVALRERGATIIHAPSGCMDKYAGIGIITGKNKVVCVNIGINKGITNPIGIEAQALFDTE